MKEYTQKPEKQSRILGSTPRISRVVYDILQAYGNVGIGIKANMIGEKVIQRISYEKAVKKPKGFNKNNWPKSLSSSGKEADSSIGKIANDGLAFLGLSDICMSAHMIPKRIGGLGDDTNVRPWLKKFEDGKWKMDIEDEFDKLLEHAKEEEVVRYKVETAEMNSLDARNVVDYYKPNEAIASKEICVNKIINIPKKVSATVSNDAWSKTLNETSDCTPILPEAFVPQLFIPSLVESPSVLPKSSVTPLTASVIPTRTVPALVIPESSK